MKIVAFVLACILGIVLTIKFGLLVGWCLVVGFAIGVYLRRESIARHETEQR